MRGILSYGTYVPRWRLDLADVSAFLKKGGGKGTRAVASYDQDTTTLGFEAARRAVSGLTPGSEPEEIWFATSEPAYADKTNANAIHAPLRASSEVSTMDMVGAVRCGLGALRIALGATGRELVIAADTRGGLPGSQDEASGGDGAAAVVVGSDDDGPLIATHIASSSAVSEFLDRWRIPGDSSSGVWEERMGESVHSRLFVDAWKRACGDAGVDPGGVDHLVITGTHDRGIRAAASESGVPKERHVLSLSRTVGNTGAADPLLLLGTVLDTAGPGETVAVVCLSDGVDVVFFKTTDALLTGRQALPVAAQVDDSLKLDYARFCSGAPSSRPILLVGHTPTGCREQRPHETRSGNSGSWAAATGRAARSICHRRGYRCGATRSTTWSPLQCLTPWERSPPSLSTT